MGWIDQGSQMLKKGFPSVSHERKGYPELWQCRIISTVSRVHLEEIVLNQSQRFVGTLACGVYMCEI